MPFVLIQPGRCPTDLVGIVLKRNLLLLSEEFLETHGIENALYAEIRADLQARIIAIEFREYPNTTSYKITCPKNGKHKLIQINKLISLLGEPPKENKQVSFEYKKEFEGMKNIFLLDFSPFFDIECKDR